MFTLDRKEFPDPGFVGRAVIWENVLRDLVEPQHSCDLLRIPDRQRQLLLSLVHQESTVFTITRDKVPNGVEGREGNDLLHWDMAIGRDPGPKCLQRVIWR